MRISWVVVAPLVAVAALAVAWGSHPGAVAGSLIGVALIAAVLAGVHHAEVVAHRIGEPLGSLVLAVAVTVIEVGLIVALMAGGGDEASTLARDTVFAAVMITVNGIAGIALLVGALRHHLAVFNPEGTGSSLATVLTLAGLTLVVPTFTVSSPGPVFSGAQLAFAAVASLALYGVFVFTQTVRHRDFFLPVAGDEHADEHAEPPTTRATLTSMALLVVSLVAVVGLAKVESYPIKDAVHSLGFPEATVGVVIALLVLLPELIAAVRAAVRDEVQISLNLAYGSAMASIGLTIPAIALATVWIHGPLALGLDSLQLALLTLTGLVAVLTVVPGRAKPLNGFVHLVLLAAFLFLTAKP
ncbi:ionic transporter y4hA [Nocardioides maradonensis]